MEKESKFKKGDLVILKKRAPKPYNKCIPQDVVDRLQECTFTVTKVESGITTPYWYSVKETGYIFPQEMLKRAPKYPLAVTGRLHGGLHSANSTTKRREKKHHD